MNTILKDYLEYAKEKSNIDEVQDTKLIKKNEKFLKLKELEHSDDIPKICKELSLSLNDMDILKSFSTSNFIAHSFYHEDNIDEEIGKKIIDLFYKNIYYACKYINDAALAYNIDEDDLTTDDIDNLDIDIMYRIDYEALAAFTGIDTMIPAIMTLTCGNLNLREYFRSLEPTEYIEYIETYIPSMRYLHVGIDASLKTKILVLSPKAERGFFIETADTNNCFHLITLLENEIYNKKLLKRYGIDNFEFNELVYKVARGEEYSQEIIETTAHQQYYTIYALQSDGSYKIEDDNGELDLDNILHSDISPEDIPQIEGTPIIIMDSEGMWTKPIKWDNSYFTKLHQKLNPYVNILDEITDEEYKSWIDKIKKFN